MVNLTRIYTKTGDDGTTSLGDMSRTSKNDPRLEAYATVDEANSTIGVVLATDELTDEVRALLVRIQNDLFDVGADLLGLGLMRTEIDGDIRPGTGKGHGGRPPDARRCARDQGHLAVRHCPSLPVVCHPGNL